VAGDGTVLIQLKMPELNKTRAYTVEVPSPEEKEMEYEIDHLDVLVFADNGGDADTFLYTTVPTEVEDPNSPISRTYVLPVRKSEGSVKQRLVMIANLKDEVAALIANELSGEDATTKTKGNLLRLLTFEDRADKWCAYEKPLPMWGESSASAIITPTSTGSAFGDIKMLFSVAKIEVGLGGNSNLTEVTDLEYFVMTDAHLINGLKLGYAAPLSTNYSAGKVTAPSIPAGNAKSTNEVSYRADVGILWVAFYTQEIDNTTKSNDDNLYLLIEGQYVAPGTIPNESTPKTWYRVDFYDRSATDPQAGILDILRGHRYMVNITGVDGPGYATADQAAASFTTKMNATVTVWNGGNIEVDPAGVYQLNVSESEWAFGGLARTAESIDNKVTISTDYYGGWEVTSITDETGSDIDWLTMSDNSGDADEIATVSINATAYDSQTPRYGRITVEAGKWSYVINVRQQLGVLEVSPAELVLDFDYYQVPLARTKLTFDSDGGWMLDRIVYTSGTTTGWLSVIDPLYANPLAIFTPSETDLPAGELRDTENAYLRLSANTESNVRTATVYFKNIDGAETEVKVRQGWINCGVGGVVKYRTIGGNTYPTHIYGTNIRRIGESMDKVVGYFDALVAAYEAMGDKEQGENLKNQAISYIYDPVQTPDENKCSCLMLANSREGTYVQGTETLPSGPYYITDYTDTSTGVHYTAASACPTGWRLPNRDDLWNMLVGAAAKINYGLNYYTPDYALWDTPEVYSGAFPYAYDRVVTEGTNYTSGRVTGNSGNSGYGYWHADAIDIPYSYSYTYSYSGNSDPRYNYTNTYAYTQQDRLYLSVRRNNNGEIWTNTTGINISYNWTDTYVYEDPSIPTRTVTDAYTNENINVLLPVRCVEDVPVLEYPLHNE
jgi:hypothetical protein